MKYSVPRIGVALISFTCCLSLIGTVGCDDSPKPLKRAPMRVPLENIKPYYEIETGENEVVLRPRGRHTTVENVIATPGEDFLDVDIVGYVNSTQATVDFTATVVLGSVITIVPAQVVDAYMSGDMMTRFEKQIRVSNLLAGEYRVHVLGHVDTNGTSEYKTVSTIATVGKLD
ncbi:MAG: hypothetical protein O3A46_11345 [Candidatus Poribacteria bacterium]|nr:hypothetical protein [Candidatus Poribacteria bacterium]